MKTTYERAIEAAIDTIEFWHEENMSKMNPEERHSLVEEAERASCLTPEEMVHVVDTMLENDEDSQADFSCWAEELEVDVEDFFFDAYEQILEEEK